MADVPVERKSEVKASVSPIFRDGALVGYRVSFVPPSHSEEEHEIEKALFGPDLNPITHEVSFDVVSPEAVAQGRHAAENFKRAREGKLSLEDEAKAKLAAEERSAKDKQAADEAKAKEDAAKAAGFSSAAEQEAHAKKVREQEDLGAAFERGRHRAASEVPGSPVDMLKK